MRRFYGSLLIFVAALLLAGCGGAAKATHHHATPRTPASATGAVAFTYHHLYTLPAPLRDPAYTWLGVKRYVLIGGLNAADVSTGEVDIGDLHGVRQVATIGTPQHDAQAALLFPKVYVFGGGGLSELSHIFSFDPRSNAIQTAGTLPTPQSDSAVTRIGGTAYVVGGYNGSAWLKTILAYRPGSAPRVAGTMPIGLRYAAVTAVGGKLLIVGGTLPNGRAGNEVWSFDPATRKLSQIATLGTRLTHAEAVTFRGFVYVIGGATSPTVADTQTRAILAINPANGDVTPDGSLPAGLSDAAVMSTGKAIVVIGGYERGGAVSDNVGELVPPTD
jgi:N-acetylneuraminic acid mutarotase